MLGIDTVPGFALSTAAGTPKVVVRPIPVNVAVRASPTVPLGVATRDLDRARTLRNRRGIIKRGSTRHATIPRGDMIKSGFLARSESGMSDDWRTAVNIQSKAARKECGCE